MKKWQKTLLWVFVIALLGFGIMKGYLYYLNNKPHRDVTKELGVSVTADQIFTDFTSNEDSAYKKYHDKAIQVTGEVAEVKKNQDSNTVVLMKTTDPVFGVNCTFKEDPGMLQPGNKITFKGICTGFIGDVVINEGVLIKQ